jgi:hypothetical protein
MNGLLSCPQDGVWLAAPDLVGPCRNLDAAVHLSGSAGEDEEEEEEEDMGQRSSSLLAARTRPKISLTWVLRGDRQNGSTITTATTTTTTSATATIATPPSLAVDEPRPSSATANSPEKAAANSVSAKVSGGSNSSNRSVSAITKRALSEPSLLLANSESGRTGRSSRERHRHRRTRTPRHKTEKERRHSRFGYEIQDVNAFLTKVCSFTTLEYNKSAF